jgi:hypothetical protein
LDEQIEKEILNLTRKVEAYYQTQYGLNVSLKPTLGQLHQAKLNEEYMLSEELDDEIENAINIYDFENETFDKVNVIEAVFPDKETVTLEDMLLLINSHSDRPKMTQTVMMYLMHLADGEGWVRDPYYNIGKYLLLNSKNAGTKALTDEEVEQVYKEAEESALKKVEKYDSLSNEQQELQDLINMLVTKALTKRVFSPDKSNIRKVVAFLESIGFIEYRAYEKFHDILFPGTKRYSLKPFSKYSTLCIKLNTAVIENGFTQALKAKKSDYEEARGLIEQGLPINEAIQEFYGRINSKLDKILAERKMFVGVRDAITDKKIDLSKEFDNLTEVDAWYEKNKGGLLKLGAIKYEEKVFKQAIKEAEEVANG